jgi:hypothetical protein
MKEPLVPIFYQDCTPNASPYPEPEVTMWGTVPMRGQPPPAVRPERTRLPPPPNSLQPSRPTAPLKDMLLRSALPAKRRLSPPPKPDTLNLGRLYV